MQAPGGYPIAYPAGGQADFAQLTELDGAVLTLGEPCYSRVEGGFVTMRLVAGRLFTDPRHAGQHAAPRATAGSRT